MAENITTYQISGQVIDNASDTGLANLTVQAWDSTDAALAVPLASGQTDVNGRFSLQFDPVQFHLGAPPNAYFKVLKGDTLLTTSQNQVVWNAQAQEDVTLYVVTAASQPVGQDLYTGPQLLTMTDFVRKSDFKGVFTQFTGSSGTVLGVVGNMFFNSLTNLNRAPITVNVQTSDIAGQNVDAATQRLADKQVTVNKVYAYSPAVNGATLKMLTGLPLNLQPGQSVDLYQQNGVVRYYAVAPAGAASGTPAGSAGTPAAAAASPEDQVVKLQAQLDSLQKDHEALKAMIQTKFPG